MAKKETKKEAQKEAIITIPLNKNLKDYYTKKHIDINKNYVCLLTMNKDKAIEQEYFSIEGFKKWRDDKAREFATNMLNSTSNNLMQYLKQNKHLFQGLTNMIGGDGEERIPPFEVYIPDEKNKKTKEGNQKKAGKKDRKKT